MDNNHIINRITQLFALAIDCEISDEQFRQLKELVHNDAIAREHYYHLVNLEVILQDYEDYSVFDESFSDDIYDKGLWNELLLQEQLTPTAEIHQEKPQRELIQKVVYHPREKRKISKFNLVFLALNAAAVLFVVLFLKFAPQSSGVEVATLTDTANAKWLEAVGSMEKGTRLTTRSEALLLQEGLVELLFDNSAKVFIEGPAKFELLAEDQIELSFGRVYAIVPEEAYGFAIKTGDSKIIDLGTEFGVQKDSDGTYTEVHVFKGKVRFLAGIQDSKIDMEVSEGNASKVNGLTGEVQNTRSNDTLFAHNVESYIKDDFRSTALPVALPVNIIGVNVGKKYSIDSTQTAGVRLYGYNQANWNNVFGTSSGLASNLVDNSGRSTTLSLSWTGSSDTFNVTGTGDKILTSTFVKRGVFVLKDIPYTSYDLVLYYNSFNVKYNDSRIDFDYGSDASVDRSVYISDRDPHLSTDGSDYVEFISDISPDGAPSGANFGIVKGLTASDLTVSVINDADRQCALAGFQIIGAGDRDETDPLVSSVQHTNSSYNPVPDNIFIDGVFIPDGGDGPVTISSQEHRFVCPATSGKNSRKIAVFYKAYEATASDPPQPALFDGILHGSKEHPCVLLHSNVGITIDLDRVREVYPGADIRTLQTGYGLTWKEKQGKAEFFILVDGVLKHEHRDLKSRKDSLSATVELKPDARFLTFVVTDDQKSFSPSEDAYKYDFFYLLDPQLVLRKNMTFGSHEWIDKQCV